MPKVPKEPVLGKANLSHFLLATTLISRTVSHQAHQRVKYRDTTRLRSSGCHFLIAVPQPHRCHRHSLSRLRGCHRPSRSLRPYSQHRSITRSNNIGPRHFPKQLPFRARRGKPAATPLSLQFTMVSLISNLIQLRRKEQIGQNASAASVGPERCSRNSRALGRCSAEARRPRGRNATYLGLT